MWGKIGAFYYEGKALKPKTAAEQPASLCRVPGQLCSAGGRGSQHSWEMGFWAQLPDMLTFAVSALSAQLGHWELSAGTAALCLVPIAPLLLYWMVGLAIENPGCPGARLPSLAFSAGFSLLLPATQLGSKLVIKSQRGQESALGKASTYLAPRPIDFPMPPVSPSWPKAEQGEGSSCAVAARLATVAKCPFLALHCSGPS